MKKIVWSMVLMVYLPMSAISSVMNHRLISSAPLLYKQNDYSFDNLSLELEPLITESFNPDHIIENLTFNNRTTFSFDQLGKGDMNPGWLYLGSTNGSLDYASDVSFNPEQQLYGLLFHWYQQYKHAFFDVRTSLLQSKSKITISEVGGLNGGAYDVNIHDAYDAFTQSSFLYGKIGEQQEVIGFDNIQVMLGGTGQMQNSDHARSDIFVAGFALFEVPTGSGTKAEWLFESQVGGNHWAFGAGVDLMFAARHGYNLVLGGNFRHYIANWETRSFDLINNGSWSRYLQLQSMDLLDGFYIMDQGLPGINLFTQSALIEGRNQINFYSRLKKDFGGGSIELSYNYFYLEAETISRVTPIAPGYGIYALGTNGGLSTASTATISQGGIHEPTVLDVVPVELTTADLNVASGAQARSTNNSFAVRFQRMCDIYTYGFGASVDLAHTAQSISSWAVWFDFEFLFDLNKYDEA